MTYGELLAAELSSRDFVTRALGLLEADFRAFALRALARWLQLGWAAEELFPCVGALGRPSWGSWNGLLRALDKARRRWLRAGRSEADAAAAKALHALHRHLESRVTERELAEPLAALTEVQLGKRLKLKTLLGLPITLRNAIAHFAPVDDAWWDAAAAALRPLLRFHERERPCAFGGDDRPEPWFLERDGQVYSYAGLGKQQTVVYAAAGAAPLTAPERYGAVMLAFRRLLGKLAAQEDDFRRLLRRLAPDEARGVLLGDFLLHERVGRGGFATVYRARQLSTGLKVAVKVLHDGASAETHERFRQEAAYLALFADHPHVVDVLGQGEEPWRLPHHGAPVGTDWYDELAGGARVRSFLALEWVDGPTLEELFRAPEPPPRRRLIEIYAEAAEALEAVHGAGLIHRDIKPSNLMLSGEGVLKLMDFGIARSQEASRTLQTVTGKVLGTPAYMSPEQIRAFEAGDSSGLGPATDLYSLGATFYELFTRARLFDHDTASDSDVRSRKLDGVLPVRPRRLAPDLPWQLEMVLLGCLQGAVKDRYPTAGALRADLGRLLGDRPITYRRPSPLRRLQLSYRRHRTATRLAVVLLTLFVGGTLALFLRPAQLLLRSQPPGSTVFIDGLPLAEPLGSEARAVPLDFGLHTVEIHQQRYHPIVRRVEVAWGQARWLADEPALVHAPAFRLYTFSSAPAEATVEVVDARGALVARLLTPQVVELPEGSFRVTFHREGHRDPEPGSLLEVVGGTEPGTVHRQLRADERPLWVHDAGTDITTTPQLYDLDGDGAREILFGTRRTGLWCLDSAGQPRWSSDRHGELWTTPRVVELLPSSPGLEVLVAGDDGALSCLSAEGAELWRRHLGGEALRSTPTVADLDGDGTLEVLGCTSRRGLLVCLGADGTPRWELLLEGRVDAATAAADLDRDGRLEVLVPVESRLACVRAGEELWSVEVGGRQINNMPACADLVGDADLEVVIGGHGGRILCLRADGEELWSFDAATRVSTTAALVDLSGDGRLELCATTRGGVILCLDAEGGLVWRLETGTPSESPPAIADFDGDGRPELVSVSDNGQVVGVSADGRLLWRYDMAGSGWYGGPAVADLDGDGRLEVVAGSAETHYGGGKLHCLRPDRWLRWVAGDGEATGGPLALADLDGDGVEEVLAVRGAGASQLDALAAESGRRLWSARASKDIVAVPVLVPGDTTRVLFTSLDTHVYCVDAANGAQLWRAEVPTANLLAAPTPFDVDGDGRPEIAVAALDRRVHLFDLHGARRWRSELFDSALNATPLALADTLLVVAARDGRVYGVDRAGRTRWRHPDGDGASPFLARPVLTELDGSPALLAVALEGRLHCLGTDGRPRWTAALGEVACDAAALAVDLVGGPEREVVVVASDSPGRTQWGRVTCLSPDGAALWSFPAAGETQGPVLADPIAADLDGDGRAEVILAARDGHLTVLDAGGRRLLRYAPAAPDGSPPGLRYAPVARDVDGDGRDELFVPVGDGRVLALAPLLPGRVLWSFPAGPVQGN